jgi:CheY-like chemotaxis protein
MFRRRVVFIDDDEDILQFLKQALSSKDIEVTCFTTSSKETLDQIEQISPGLIFIDYQITEQDGILLLHKLKKFLPHSKMIILTGAGDERVAVQAMKAGADDYLVKPIQQDKLRETVDQYFLQFFARILPLNEKYQYLLSDIAITRYEFLRASYSNIFKSIKDVCNFFAFSRQDFYNYEKRFQKYGPAGLLKKKDFEKLPYHHEHTRELSKNHTTLQDFIDPNDDIQVKLEMMREAATAHKPNICDISEKYGFTREAFYQIYRRFQVEGLLALTEKKKGRPKHRSFP